MTENLPAELAGELRHSVTRLYLALRRNSPITDLSAAQASALATISDHGPMRMGALADREGVRMPTATNLVDVLARDGLVTRDPDPDDRRAVVIALTDEGQTIIRDVRTRRDDVVASALAQLSDEQLAALAAAAPALRDLRTRLEK
ncbi:MarR family transcriptional regulator [Gordonia sp. HY285]|uniref:MarR family transcriptional regulator n=1 Tax=Gordonia liuliyuniae TaxID=2911517 RepID=A0ABS9ITZ7_9ACTN|nr:MarR family transcriptional regulator [Gordonia liuliyuniae]MCF8589033.1 MarR family transcriptional regulator [Gordonia liuliyuniae]MCF8609097.1 MarR family transcriptional regulator [Gordonia liuliyuniae]